MHACMRTCVAMRPENETSEIDWVISPIRMLNGSIFTCFDNSSCVSSKISTSRCNSCDKIKSRTSTTAMHAHMSNLLKQGGARMCHAAAAALPFTFLKKKYRHAKEEEEEEELYE